MTGVFRPPARRIQKRAFVLSLASGAHELEASGVTAGSPTLGMPALGQIHALTGTGVTAGAPALDSPALGQVHALTGTAVTAGSPVLGLPTLSEPQKARPASDISAGTWTASTGSDLYAMLNEASPSDADYIVSGNNPSADTCEVKLSAVSDPQVSSGYIVRYRIEKEGTATASLVFYLIEGSTQRATWTVNNVPDAVTAGEYELSEAEANSISNHADLRIRMEATVS